MDFLRLSRSGTSVVLDAPGARLLILVAAIALLFAGGCTNDPEPVDREQRLEDAGIKPDEEDDSTVEATDDQSEEEIAEQLDGEIVINAQLRPGECFNEYAYIDRTGARQQFTTRVDCARAHDKEMYFVVRYPADTNEGFIGNEELTEWANKQCLKEFEPYVGMEFVLSELQIGILQPDLAAWSPPTNDRTVRCYLYVDGYNLQGSMKNISI